MHRPARASVHPSPANLYQSQYPRTAQVHSHSSPHMYTHTHQYTPHTALTTTTLPPPPRSTPPHPTPPHPSSPPPPRCPPQLKWYSPEAHSNTDSYKAGTGVVIAIVLANLWLGYLTWHQFGWRMHSRFGCDLRRKSATQRLQLFFLTNRFRTLVRADVQLLLLVCANGVVIAIGRLIEPDQRALEERRGVCIGMVVCCFAGLALQYAWVQVCQAAVRGCDRGLESLATVTVSGLGFWPLIMAYLVLLGQWPATPSGQATILVPLGVWLVLRMALWWHMRVLIEELEAPEMREALSNSSGPEPEALAGDDVPPALAPLLRGAWLVSGPGLCVAVCAQVYSM
jgi:hypothetical protein